MSSLEEINLRPRTLGGESSARPARVCVVVARPRLLGLPHTSPPSSGQSSEGAAPAVAPGLELENHMAPISKCPSVRHIIRLALFLESQEAGEKDCCSASFPLVRPLIIGRGVARELPASACSAALQTRPPRAMVRSIDSDLSAPTRNGACNLDFCSLRGGRASVAEPRCVASAIFRVDERAKRELCRLVLCQIVCLN